MTRLIYGRHRTGGGFGSRYCEQVDKKSDLLLFEAEQARAGDSRLCSAFTRRRVLFLSSVDTFLWTRRSRCTATAPLVAVASAAPKAPHQPQTRSRALPGESLQSHTPTGLPASLKLTVRHLAIYNTRIDRSFVFPGSLSSQSKQKHFAAISEVHSRPLWGLNPSLEVCFTATAAAQRVTGLLPVQTPRNSLPVLSWQPQSPLPCPHARPNQSILMQSCLSSAKTCLASMQDLRSWNY